MGNSKHEILLLIVVIQFFGFALLWHQQNANFTRLQNLSQVSKHEHPVANSRTTATRLEEAVADSNNTQALLHQEAGSTSTLSTREKGARDNSTESESTTADSSARRQLKQNFSTLMESFLDAYEQRKEHDEMMAELEAPVHTLPIDPGLDEPMVPDLPENRVHIYDI